MDIDRARTFLEIIHTGSFQKAAIRLNVTQTTVSARIRMLEGELGRRLFTRNRNGAVLTAAGHAFERFAQTFVQVWERARQQLQTPPGRTGVIALGGELSLWNPLLIDWLVWMKQEQPHTAIRTHVAVADHLLEQLRIGLLDLAVIYAPRLMPGFKVEMIEEEKLILVRKCDAAGRTEYVHVDWGPQFAMQGGIGLAAFHQPGLMVDLGPLGLNYILRAGGMGYLRWNSVAEHLASGELELVEGAPEFSYPIYAVYPETADDRHDIRQALNGLKAAAGRGSPVAQDNNTA